MNPARPNRTRGIVAGLAATAVLLVVGCSRNSPQDPAAPMPATVPGSTADNSTANGSTVSGSTVSGELPSNTGPTASSSSGRSSKPASTTARPSGSAAVGTFSAATGAWFDGLCRGLQNKPRDEFAGLTGDLEAQKSAGAALFTDQAKTLDASVTAMKKAGSPNIPKGEKFDAAVRETYPKMAAAARAAAIAVAATSSADGLGKAFTAGRAAVTTAAAPLGVYGAIIGAPAVAGPMAKIPSCAPIVG